MIRLVGVLLCAIAVIAAWISRDAASDDAYITLRIARNALEGNGFHYNVGEAGVQAATSPLNLLLSYAIGKVGMIFGGGVEDSLIYAPGILSLFALPALALGVFVILNRRSRNWIGPMVGALMAALSPIVLVTVGLETQLLVALIVWALVAYDSSKLMLSGALTGLAVLARHDAIILLGILIVALYLSKQKQEVLRLLAPSVLVVLPWFALSAIAFGHTVPTTLASKMAQGGTAYWPGSYYAQFWKWMVNCSFGSTFVAGIVTILAAIGLLLAFRAKNQALLALALYFGLHFAAYSFLNVPDYHWYFAPYFVGLVALAGFAIGTLPNRFWVSATGTAIIAGIAIVGLSRAPKVETRLEAYRSVGRFLNDNPPKNAAGMMEIGIIGFYAPKIKVFDFSGIVTPEQIPRVRLNAAIAWIDNPSVADKVVTRLVKHPLEPDLFPDFNKVYEREFATEPSELFPNGVQVWKLR